VCAGLSLAGAIAGLRTPSRRVTGRGLPG